MQISKVQDGIILKAFVKVFDYNEYVIDISNIYGNLGEIIEDFLFYMIHEEI